MCGQWLHFQCPCGAAPTYRGACLSNRVFCPVSRSGAFRSSRLCDCWRARPSRCLAGQSLHPQRPCGAASACGGACVGDRASRSVPRSGASRPACLRACRCAGCPSCCLAGQSLHPQRPCGAASACGGACVGDRASRSTPRSGASRPTCRRACRCAGCGRSSGRGDAPRCAAAWGASPAAPSCEGRRSRVSGGPGGAGALGTGRARRRAALVEAGVQSGTAPSFGRRSCYRRVAWIARDRCRSGPGCAEGEGSRG